MQDKEPTSDPGPTPPLWADVPQMLQSLCETHAARTAFRARSSGGWRDVGWDEVARSAAAVGLAAGAHGLARGEAVAILASPCPEWLQVDLGLVGVGLISVGIYPTEPPDKLAFLLNDCGAQAIFVDSEAQLEKVRSVRGRCPALKTVVLMGGAAPHGVDDVVALADWIAAGAELARQDPGAFRRAGEAVQPGDTAILIYTSGTTGPPKGAMITHGNVAYQVSHGPALFGMQAGWRRPAFLPLCHIAERMFSYFAMAAGMTSWFVDGPGELLTALPEIRPQFLLAVPRVFEKLQAAAQAWVERQPPGRRIALRAAQGGHVEDAEADLAALREALGLGEAVRLWSGGARFPVALARWQQSVGLPVRELYGMTESGTIAAGRRPSIGNGDVGPPCIHGELRLGANDEIVIRGPHVFAGYHNRPDASAEVLRDGWFHTGDVGRLAADGGLILLDRLKDIIVSSSGKNITPSEVESALKASPLIADAVAVGDGRHFLTALILLDVEAARGALAGPASEDLAALAQSPVVQAMIAAAVETANRGLSRPESVRAFRILPHVLSPTDEAITPTLKIKRRVLTQRYAALIEDMYATAR